MAMREECMVHLVHGEEFVYVSRDEIAAESDELLVRNSSPQAHLMNFCV